ncbi:hypothetical protein [Natrinema longum]|uniref:hypothetical protein n=1 Tax=Natrinema longum TaxID=370324 RepID=UPI001CCAAECD|nr:hypothetical protein [Natrinema longum]MBZ6494692.1 hypothetical protein [Natrinema longum]
MPAWQPPHAVGIGGRLREQLVEAVPLEPIDDRPAFALGDSFSKHRFSNSSQTRGYDW